MNAETVALLVRPYQEIVDDILTAIVGGVVNEPIFFDLKEDLYPLQKPATDVRGITGTATVTLEDGSLQPKNRAFQKSVDFIFREGDNGILWLPEGKRPDDETVFYVDYFLRDSNSPLSDINVGSVTRTIGEAIGREIATVYQQINQAYLSGFVDTAEGTSLDFVVAILGVKRKTKESAIGLVTFFRSPEVPDGNITIPENTLLSTDKGEATFVTAELRTLQRGQVRIDVPIRATAASAGEKGVVAAGAITKLAQPIAGINRVTNFEATVLGTQDETDPQLRARAKAVLRGLGKATIAALTNVVFENRAKLVEISDPNSQPGKRSAPGTVTLLVESEPERFLSLQAAVEQTRAAGVRATLLARYVFFKPRVRARIQPGVTAAGKLKIKDQIIEAMQNYVDPLEAGEPATGEDLLKAITSVKEVSKKKGETRIVDVLTSRADLGQPGPETIVKALLDAVDSVQANALATDAAARTAALTTALNNVLGEAAPVAPTERRIPDRSLLQSLGEGRSSQRAGDEDIEIGEFQVAAVVDGQNWWVVLDVTPDDIRLEEA